MKLYNTLTKKVEDFQPLDKKQVTVYSCGPTVYDHIHIGNLSSFIYADTLRRTLVRMGYNVRHVMNFTDVDDKTIRRSQEQYPDLSPEEALQKLTREYEQIFLKDMHAIGNDIENLTFVRATEKVNLMQSLIKKLYHDGFAYIADDGVYFSIEKYRASGKTYGQLLQLTPANTSAARINNDEYDKENAHDFVLWKVHRDNEPAWDFELDGHNLLGRPGWHIECSAMSTEILGQPFDIHTGGVDLIFPHHENEIAQSTAGQKNATYACFFFHNEHLLVEGKKMSKSLNNFYTLADIQEKGFEPLAFRLTVLQSHYRSQANFTWENLAAAQNRLKDLQALADLRWQLPNHQTGVHNKHFDINNLLQALQDDLNTPQALAIIADLQSTVPELLSGVDSPSLMAFLELLDDILGLQLLGTADITENQKRLLGERQKARTAKAWSQSDELRSVLMEQGIGIRDTQEGQIWYRV